MLVSELQTFGDVSVVKWILNSSHTPKETSLIEPTTYCTCRGLDPNSDLIVRGVVIGVSMAEATIEVSMSSESLVVDRFSARLVGYDGPGNNQSNG